MKIWVVEWCIFFIKKLITNYNIISISESNLPTLNVRSLIAFGELNN